MPLHGKIVVIKRSGGDGTEFPLTATCLFGRKPDCDIRIQLPQVSKEHCRIDLNENKEVVLTNLSSVNPTRVNGEALQQSERLKHGDVITIIDRSFRFEYPPAPTPKKRTSRGDKSETFKVIQDQQVGDAVVTETGERKTSEVSTDPHLKDGANHDNIQRSLDKTLELESKEDASLQQSKASPFSDLYQMIKQSLDVKTPRKSSVSLLQTPSSKFCTPKPASVRRGSGKPDISTEDEAMPKTGEAHEETKGEAENAKSGTPKSAKKQRRSSQLPAAEVAEPEPVKSEATPQKLTASEVIEMVCAETPKSQTRRRSKEASPAKPAGIKEEKQAVASPKTQRRSSPRTSGTVKEVQKAAGKRKSGELAPDLPVSQMKRKRVSFGGHLSPELFDKRLPPDSPLRRGAAPRRSLSLLKPKQSLLRRASVIGMLQECEQSPAKSAKNSPKSKTSSPKAATPGKASPKSKTSSPKAATPASKSPKSRASSPKAATPAKASPKSKTPSPKAATPANKTPKSKASTPKAATPAKQSPKSKTPSPSRAKSPAKDEAQTPTVKGRFSVSLINTPSPVAEEPVANQAPAVTATPKIPLKRKSMKSASRKSLSKSAAKLICRRSGVSRASMKALSSWAEIVKFGQTKAHMAVPAKKTLTTKTTKTAVSKPRAKTPARKLKDHVSTGHADSPVTIVVGRAHKQKVVYAAGAAPKMVINTAVLKKDMKMDEDLTGISEMYKTPVNDKKRRSSVLQKSAMKTPAEVLGTSVVEPSVLNTPEEPDEMMVSPLGVSSAMKERGYNSEAVQRLLNEDMESSFIPDMAPLEADDEFSEVQSTDLNTPAATTPKQKPELPECLTGVKRIMKTPKQKAEPVEDLRGRLLKTPKQKLEPQECFSGVKQIFETPQKEEEPLEDLQEELLETPKAPSANVDADTKTLEILESEEQPEAAPLEADDESGELQCTDSNTSTVTTPKQKPELPECLTGVKRIMKTPKQKAEPVEDLRGRLLKTPKQKLEPQECLTGVKRIMKTPKQKAEPVEDLRGKLLKTPKQKLEPQECLTGVKRIMKTPKQKEEPVEDLRGKLLKTPKQKLEPQECLSGVKKIFETPQKEAEPLEDPDEEVLETPKAPSASGDVDDKTVESPVVCLIDIQKTMSREKSLSLHSPPCPETKVEDQTTVACAVVAAEEPDCVIEKPEDDVPSGLISSVPDVEMETDELVVVEEHFGEAPSKDDKEESSEAPEAISELATPDETGPEEQPEVEAAPENGPGEQPEVEAAPENGPEEQPEVEAAPENGPEEQPEVEAAPENVPEVDTSAAEPEQKMQPVRARRAKTVESKPEDKQETEEPSEEAEAPAPVRGRRGKRAEAVAPPAARQTTRRRNAKATENSEAEPSNVSQPAKRGRNAKTASDDVVEVIQEEQTALKPKRGRKQPQASVPEQEEVPPNNTDVVPQVDTTAAAKVEPTVDESQSSVAQEVVPQESEMETAACSIPEKKTTQAKAGRGRKVRVVEPEVAEDTQVVPETSEEPVVSAPVRGGRRVKKAEAVAPPAVKRATRGRNAKSQESTEAEMVPEKAVETTEVATEAVSDQTSPVDSQQEESAPAPPVEEPVVKPTRGRKTKTVELPQPEPEKDEALSEEQSIIAAEPQMSAPAVRKPKRGGKTKAETVEETEVAEEAVIAVETEKQPQTATRVKRGRNAKQVDEKPETSAAPEPVKRARRGRKIEQEHEEPQEDVQTTETVVPEEPEEPAIAKPAPEPVKKARRGRKVEQEHEEPQEDAQTAETVVPEEPAVSKPAPEPVKKARRGRKVEQEHEEPQENVQTAETVVPEEPEEPAVAPKPRKGGRKANQQVEQEAPAEKPKRGKRGKQAEEEVEVAPEEMPANEPEAEEKEPEAPVTKASRSRGAKKEVSQAVPAKRARRGAAAPPEETNAEVEVPESAPAKRGRRAAAAKPTAVTEERPTPPEEVVEEEKTSKKSVKWKTELEAVVKLTPVKVSHGRKTKLSEKADTEAEDASKTEEKDLSDKVVEAPPTMKRARRGAKAAEVTTEPEEPTSKGKEAETQPKTRRGRAAKK